MLITIVTGNRSERGILQSLIDYINLAPNVNCNLLDLSKDYNFGGQYNVTRSFLDSKSKSDWVFLFGDRKEQLAAAIAAAELNIPIAHHHGGDVTDSGLIDEAVRHSISRFAHIHLVANADSQQRLERMGEQNWRVVNVGSLTIDACVEGGTAQRIIEVLQSSFPNVSMTIKRMTY
jgi:UDP-N-acetylglucosamine 2-epimerase